MIPRRMRCVAAAMLSVDSFLTRTDTHSRRQWPLVALLIEPGVTLHAGGGADTLTQQPRGHGGGGIRAKDNSPDYTVLFLLLFGLKWSVTEWI